MRETVAAASLWKYLAEVKKGLSTDWSKSKRRKVRVKRKRFSAETVLKGPIFCPFSHPHFSTPQYEFLQIREDLRLSICFQEFIVLS